MSIQPRWFIGAAITTVLGIACTTASPPPTAATQPSANASAVTSVEPPVVASASSTPVVSAPAIGPAAASASRADHEKKLAALLSGEISVDALPTEATAPDKPFNPLRYSRLAKGRDPIKIKMDLATVKGGLMPEVVNRIIRQNYGRLVLCYEHGLEKTPTLAGAVTLEMSISSKGDLSPLKSIDNTLADASMVTCIENAMQKVSFPESETGNGTEAKLNLKFSLE
ncbi:MAG: AgmX/PglI C-terminal domain-containing protein [Polyangiaceae bacterium]